MEPELLFGLRRVDAKELIARAGDGGIPVQKLPDAGRVLSMLPRAAEFYRRQVMHGLGGRSARGAQGGRDPELVVDGKIVLSPGEGGSLWLKSSMAPAMLLKATENQWSG